MKIHEADHLTQGDSVHHGFYGRRGGVSSGLYDSLNCGLGTQDDSDAVHENRSRVAGEFGLSAEQLVTTYQCHSAACTYVDAPFSGGRPKVDAMVTDKAGLALGILTADCGPVLFAGRKANGAPVIGAAHAGWGGALRGVLENTLQAMGEAGAAWGSIRAAVGPCIGPASYEVSAGFDDPFLKDDPQAEKFFKAGRREGHLMFDLPGYIAFRLARAGVSQVEIAGVDTYRNEADCFSYRRTTHRGEADYGRQVSVIAISL